MNRLDIGSNDSNAVEVGVRFRADQGGTITGVRFYKAAANTGTHVGNLWSSTGTLLASATGPDGAVSTFGYDDVLRIASAARGDDPFGYRSEFLQLVRAAKTAPDALATAVAQSILSVALSPALKAARSSSFRSILIQCPKLPSGSNTVWN